MKACHACGQKLPLKVGDVVEGTVFGGDGKRQGIVLVTGTTWTDIQTFAGTRLVLKTKGLTRLHGYYRVTEREPLA